MAVYVLYANSQKASLTVCEMDMPSFSPDSCSSIHFQDSSAQELPKGPKQDVLIQAYVQRTRCPKVSVGAKEVGKVEECQAFVETRCANLLTLLTTTTMTAIPFGGRAFETLESRAIMVSRPCFHG